VLAGKRGAERDVVGFSAFADRQHAAGHAGGAAAAEGDRGKIDDVADREAADDETGRNRGAADLQRRGVLEHDARAGGAGRQHQQAAIDNRGAAQRAAGRHELGAAGEDDRAAGDAARRHELRAAGQDRSADGGAVGRQDFLSAAADDRAAVETALDQRGAAPLSNWVPPEISASRSVPPASTVSEPPLSIVVDVAVPESKTNPSTSISPPLLMIVPTADP
jgi:hypothetical protein